MNLFLLMLERGGLIILLAYLMVNIPYFKALINQPSKPKSQVILWGLFSIFVIISNYTGVEVLEDLTFVNQSFQSIQSTSSVANTRVLTIGVSGLIGGPIVGIGVGIASAIFRLLQGGLSPHIYVISSLLIGGCSGIIGLYLRKKQGNVIVKQAVFVGLLMEMIQMLCILIFSTQFQSAFALVKVIALPMILTNSIGTAIFVSIINSAKKLEEQAKAVQTHEVLALANQTLPYFRKGLSASSCYPVAVIIHQSMQVAAVSLTDTNQILAFVGEGEDHHITNGEILTQLAKRAIETGKIGIAHQKCEIECDHGDCPLASAIVIPLRDEQKTIGTLKLYFSKDKPMTYVDQQLAEGLGTIFSTQIALGQAEIATRLLKDLEMKSLQAQVNPHFLFNSLNTINALIRMDSEKARELVQEFSHFLRGNLQGTRKNLIPLQEELDQVNAYLALENARFPNKVEVKIDNQLEAENPLIPPFALQVLVENAYKHGFKHRKVQNQLTIHLQKMDGYYQLMVQDNGQGIPKEKFNALGKQTLESEEGTGSALQNLARRLNLLYGTDSHLTFETSSVGTNVKINIPMKKEGL